MTSTFRMIFGSNPKPGEIWEDEAEAKNPFSKRKQTIEILEVKDDHAMFLYHGWREGAIDSADFMYIRTIYRKISP